VPNLSAERLAAAPLLLLVVQEEQQAEEAAAFEARQPTKRDVSASTWKL
jgi:hypothetical protein